MFHLWALAVLVGALPGALGLFTQGDAQCEECTCAASGCMCFAAANGVFIDTGHATGGRTDSIPAFFIGLMAGFFLMRAMGTRRFSGRSRSVQTSVLAGSNMLSAGVQTAPTPQTPPAQHVPRLHYPATVSRAMQTMPPPAAYSLGSQTRGVLVAHVSTQSLSTAGLQTTGFG